MIKNSNAGPSESGEATDVSHDQEGRQFPPMPAETNQPEKLIESSSMFVAEDPEWYFDTFTVD